MTRSTRIANPLQKVLLLFLLLSMLVICIPTQAAEPNEVPVKLTVTSERTPIRLGDDITMYGNEEKWTGKGSVFISAKDNMLPVVTTVPAIITLSPAKALK